MENAKSLGHVAEGASNHFPVRGIGLGLADGMEVGEYLAGECAVGMIVKGCADLLTEASDDFWNWLLL